MSCYHVKPPNDKLAPGASAHWQKSKTMDVCVGSCIKLLGAHTRVPALIEFILLVCGEEQCIALCMQCIHVNNYAYYMYVRVYVRTYVHDTTFVCSYLVTMVLFSAYAMTTKFAPSLEIQNSFPRISAAALRRGSRPTYKSTNSPFV